MAPKQHAAFVTARKGFCYLTVKIGRRNFHIMRIRNYTIDAQDKRDMRRLYPDVVFDWKKIGRQLAEKREACRRYRSRRRTSAPPACRAPANRCTPSMTQSPAPSMPTFLPPAEGAGALLDAILSIDRTLDDNPSQTVLLQQHGIPGPKNV